jgi:hypothetical protein
MKVLAHADWTARRDRHRTRVSELLAPHLDRQAAGLSHPVLDFLFTYYSLRPAQLQRWHPGFGVGLEGGSEYLKYKGYTSFDSCATVDPAFLQTRLRTVGFIAELLAATADRPANLGCFGMHEWAMVYRAEDVRHEVPLRLGRSGTDTVVESMPLRCTHFDAFRFFTPAAEPRNTEQLTRDDQVRTEQPGCLHATMDLYKWCYKLSPLVDSDFLVDCFELAMTARELDMRASPYDLADLGYVPIQIETASGRAEYVREQAALAARGAVLRKELLATAVSLLHLYGLAKDSQ